MKKRGKKISEEDKSQFKKNIGEGFGISGFTLGVLSIILAGWIGLLNSIVGFIFCYHQQRKNPIFLGKVGIILNIIGFIVSLIFIMVLVKILLAMQ